MVIVAYISWIFSLTLHSINDGGYSFNHETCHPVSQLKGRGPHVQKRSQGLLPVGSRVPHGTGETERTPVARHHLAVRRACAPAMRDSTLVLALFLGQHGRVFTPGPSPENPPKRYSVLKVQEQAYQKGSTMSTDNQPVDRAIASKFSSGM